MDADYLNSPIQLEQMDLMTQLMQMEKLPEYSELSSPSIECSFGPSPSFYTTPPTSSPTLIGPSSPISFSEAAIPEQLLTSLPSYLSYPYLDPSTTSMVAMKDMVFRIAATQPVNIDPVTVKPAKRKNVKISKDPQSVAARHRRERISDRIRVLQRLVPGGTKMDTASMLDEAIQYLKFLKAQVQTLERAAGNWNSTEFGFNSCMPISSGNYSCIGTTYQSTDQLFFNSMQMLS